jgi:hypothetical protein
LRLQVKINRCSGMTQIKHRETRKRSRKRPGRRARLRDVQIDIDL